MDTSKLIQEVADAISIPILDHALVGSTYICGAGNDIDLLVLVISQTEARDMAELAGFEIEGCETYDTSSFYSARKGNLNVLLTDNAEWFRLFRACAQICRYFKVVNKAERIALHRLVMDGEDLPGA